MKFELEFFDDFIKKHCHKKSKTTAQEFSRKLSQIDCEVERIKKAFTNELFTTDNERRIEQYIQHHQTHIIQLADKVATFIDREEAINLEAKAKGPTQFNLCSALLQAFEKLLNYIEIHLTKYFDQDQKIPDSYAFISVRELQEKLDIVRDILEVQKVDSGLTTLVLFPIEHFVTMPEKQNITFRRLIYLKYLANGIIRLPTQNQKDFTIALYEHLFYLNFNSYHFLHYATTVIRGQLEAQPSLTAQLEHLSLILKQINQAHVKPSFALKPNRESLKSLLSNWIEEEIHYMEKKRQLTLLIPPGDKRLETMDDFKVKTVLSVSQLAYSVRLLKEVGIITNDNKAALIRFFSKNFTSAHNENISTESFRSKFFGFERSAVVHVQGILNKLIARTKQDE